MRLKIGDDADLDVFAETYVQLFGDKIAPQSQKQLCLALYREYAKIAQTVAQGSYKSLAEARKKAYSCEAHIPPWEKQDFQRVWDEDAPARCLECNNPIPDGQSYCCLEHKNAGTKRVCGRPCGVKEGQDDLAVAHGLEEHLRCPGEVVDVKGIWVCQLCGHNKDIATKIATSSQSSSSQNTEWDDIHERSLMRRRALANMWSMKEKDENHKACWASRKRNADSVPLWPVKKRRQ